MKKISKMFLLGSLLVCLTVSAGAQVLVSYTPTSTGTGYAPYTGSAEGSALLPTVDPSVTGSITAGDFTFGPGLAASASTTYFPQVTIGRAAQELGAVFVPTTFDDSISSGGYFTFSVAPTAGNTLAISDIDFSDVGFFSTFQPFTFVLEGSQTGFGTDSSNILATYTSPEGMYQGLVVGDDVVLPLDYQALTGSTEFRIYMYETDGVQNNNVAGIEGLDVGNSFRVNGAALSIVPEPTTCTLLGLGLLLLVVWVHKQRLGCRGFFS